MDETLTTAGEPQVIESANTYEGDTQTAGLAQTIDTQVQDDGSQVIETATPMDNNVTYQNVTEDTTPSFDTNKDFTQNIVQEALQTNYQNTVAQTDGQAMTQFLDHDYDYNKSEAGTYWVAGAINDVDTQMSFLNTLVREEMYDELDLQKYYYDTTMATARAYASQKKKETAYGFYRAAQEKAIAEAQLTGWYMPAEGNYMLGQYTVAQNKLEDPDSTAEEKARAQRISGTVEKWFAANQIGTRGIKCLNMMNYEENVRHNTIMGELQKEANKIAAGQAAASAAAAKLQWRLYKFQLEEYELQSGHNITQQIGMDNKNLIGHDVSEYGGFTALEGHFGTKNTSALAEALSKSTGVYSSVLGSSSQAFVNGILEANGKDTKEAYARYNNDQKLASMKAYINSEPGKKAGYISEESGAFEKTGKTVDGKELQVTTIDNKFIPGYFEDGVFTPLTEKDKKSALGDTTVQEYLNKMYGEKNIDWSGPTSVTIDGEEYSLGRPETVWNQNSYSSNSDILGWQKFYDNYSDLFAYSEKDFEGYREKIHNIQSKKGLEIDGKVYKNLKYEDGYMDTNKSNEYNIFSSSKMIDGKEQKTYYAINYKSDGEIAIHEVNEKDIKLVPSVASTLKEGEGIGNGLELFSGDTNKERVYKASWKVGYDKEKDLTYMCLQRNGKKEFYSIKGEGSSETELGNIKVVSIDSTTVEKQAKAAGFATEESDVLSKGPSTTKEAKYNTEPQETLTSDELVEKYSSSSGGGSGGSSGPIKSGIETQDTVDNRKAEYKEYVLRMKDEPNAEILPYEEWVKNRPSINDVKAV